jgi:hypothetical protein
LIHDAALRPDEFVFGAPTEICNLFERQLDFRVTQQRRYRRNLDRCRRTQSRAKGNISGETDIEATDLNTFLQETPQYTYWIIAPVAPRVVAQTGKLENNLLPVVCRVDDRTIVITRANSGRGVKPNRHRHHEPARIVRMLPDEVYPSRSDKVPACLSKQLLVLPQCLFLFLHHVKHQLCSFI